MTYLSSVENELQSHLFIVFVRRPCRPRKVYLGSSRSLCPKTAKNIPNIYIYIFIYIYYIIVYPQNISKIAKIAGWFLPTSRLLWPSLTSALLDSMVAFRPVVSLQSSRSSINFPREPRVSWMFLFGRQVVLFGSFKMSFQKS